MLTPKPHYPFITKLLVELFNEGSLSNVQQIHIEPVYGYVGRIVYRNGAVRFFRGSSMGMNRLGASEVARDKGYTKYFLDQLGYRTPQGKVFLFPRFVDLIDRNLGRFGFSEFNHINAMLAYIEGSLGYPCYLKPNEGSQGRGIECCRSADEVRAAVENFATQGALKVIVEKAVPYPDFRVVVMGDEIISCYLRKPLELIGDGVSNILTLLQARQARFEEQGRDTVLNMDDPRIGKSLQRMGWHQHTVLATGQAWKVFDVSNLSVGGDSEDFTDAIHPHWRQLCIKITADMGLHLCGVDIACESISDPSADYSILEINAAPGLDNYAATGATQALRVRELYRRAFDECVDV
jgi:D-alanine-D-alanine ligase-like ATP-grasp enzyme